MDEVVHLLLRMGVGVIFSKDRQKNKMTMTEVIMSILDGIKRQRQCIPTDIKPLCGN